MHVAIKGQYKDGCGDENILYLDCMQVSVLLLYRRFARCYHSLRGRAERYKHVYSIQVHARL